MDIEKTIMTMEYNKRILGMGEQGNKINKNANTIACDVAIKALEKQIPEQVIRIENVASQACPMCKSKVNWNYCSNCGQRLVY